MNATEVIEAVLEAGGEIVVDGETLVVGPALVVADSLLKDIRRHSDAIALLLEEDTRLARGPGKVASVRQVRDLARLHFIRKARLSPKFDRTRYGAAGVGRTKRVEHQVIEGEHVLAALKSVSMRRYLAAFHACEISVATLGNICAVVGLGVGHASGFSRIRRLTRIAIKSLEVDAKARLPAAISEHRRDDPNASSYDPEDLADALYFFGYVAYPLSSATLEEKR